MWKTLGTLIDGLDDSRSSLVSAAVASGRGRSDTRRQEAAHAVGEMARRPAQIERGIRVVFYGKFYDSVLVYCSVICHRVL